MTVLVTGATGNVGRHLVKYLLESGESVRALTRDPENSGIPPEVEACRGDLTVPESLPPVLDDVDAVYLLPVLDAVPSFVDLAVRARVRRVVLLTGAWAAGTTARDRRSWVYPRYREAEATVADSAIPESAILRPAPFATNLLWWRRSIREEGVVRAPYGDGACPLVHERDIAAVAAAMLTEDAHVGARYLLTGPVAVTQRDQLAAIAAATGRDLRFEEVTAAQWRASSGAALPPGIAGDLLEEWSSTASDRSAALPVTTDVEKVTGKPARSVGEWAHDHADEFR